MRRLAFLTGLVVALAACGGGTADQGDPAVTTTSGGPSLTVGASPGESTSSATPAESLTDLGDDQPTTVVGQDPGLPAAEPTTSLDREDRPEPEDLPETVPVTTPAGVTGEVPAPLLAAVLDDLSARLGVAPDSMSVLAAESTVWPDGSLGCPAPGQIYQPAPVSGYRVVIEVEGAPYDYRLADTGYFLLCEPLSQP